MYIHAHIHKHTHEHTNSHACTHTIIVKFNSIAIKTLIAFNITVRTLKDVSYNTQNSLPDIITRYSVKTHFLASMTALHQ